MLKNVLNLKDEVKQPALLTSWLLVCHKKKNYYLLFFYLTDQSFFVLTQKLDSNSV